MAALVVWVYGYCGLNNRFNTRVVQKKAAFSSGSDPRGGVVLVRVLDRRGNPVPGAHIALNNSSGTVYGTTDRSGCFEYHRSEWGLSRISVSLVEAPTWGLLEDYGGIFGGLSPEPGDELEIRLRFHTEKQNDS
jgi:hypothetical protein